MKLLLPILVLIIASYLVSKIPHEKPKETVKKVTQVKSQPIPETPKVERLEAVPTRDTVRTDLDSVALAVKAESDKVFGDAYWPALWKIVMKESSWNPLAVNKSSGACGLFQALPCSKLGCELDDVPCQAKWGVSYVKQRYGNPSKALSFHLVKGWY